MTTKTGGTAATSTLTMLQVSAANSDADVATIAQAIKDITNVARPTYPGAYVKQGLLEIPGRGQIKALPGDWIAVDPSGTPFLIPSSALATTLTAVGATHTSTTVDGFTSSVLALGWQPGMVIAGTNITAGTKIASIATDGLSLTLSAAATGTGSSITFTVGSWTHS